MAESAKTPNKGGRPPKDPSGGKRPTLTFRCRSALQEKLQASAAEADRSMSEEVERRLEQSFEAADLETTLSKVIQQRENAGIEKLVGGKENLDLLIQLSHAIVLEHLRSGKHWFDDEGTRERVYQGICSSLPFILHGPAPRALSASEQVEEYRRSSADLRSRVDRTEE